MPRIPRNLNELLILGSGYAEGIQQAVVVIHELPHFDQIPDTQKHLGLVNDVCHRLKNLTYQFGMSLMTGIYAQNGIPCGTDSRGP